MQPCQQDDSRPTHQASPRLGGQRRSLTGPSTTMTPWDVASMAVSWWSLLVRTAPTRACARPRRSLALARFADPFWVRDRARCRCLMWARASRRAREASRVATSVPAAVATTAAVLTPTSTPTAAPAGLRYACGAGVAVRWKHTDAYQQPPASLLTVTLSIRARPRTSSRRSFATARPGRPTRTWRPAGGRAAVAARPAVVNRGRSRWRALNLGNRDWPFRKLVCAVCAARMPYRNAQTNWPPCHGAATLLVASQRRTRSKDENGRVRSPLGMSQVASAAHWSWFALAW